MKLIHTADLHLDSKFIGIDAKSATIRREELLLTFGAIIRRAKEGGASGIIIAGDLFDGEYPSLKARDEVKSLFLSAMDIKFYLLCGNHDGALPHSFVSSLPINVVLFDDGFKTYDIGENVRITGANDFIGEQLNLSAFDESFVNIVVAHGAPVKSGCDGINLTLLEGKNIDYLALGHYHSYSFGNLDKGVWCMCGTPEGRGFDETGVKGIVELNIENGKVSHEFVPICRRQIYDIKMDITGIKRAELYERVKNGLAREGVTKKDIVRVTLTGVTEDTETDVSMLMRRAVEEKLVSNLTVKDETSFVAEDESNISLYAEFKKQVAELSLPTEDENEVLRLGYSALHE